MKKPLRGEWIGCVLTYFAAISIASLPIGFKQAWGDYALGGSVPCLRGTSDRDVYDFSAIDPALVARAPSTAGQTCCKTSGLFEDSTRLRASHPKPGHELGTCVHEPQMVFLGSRGVPATVPYWCVSRKR